jgi:hypothetical protein
VTSTQQYVEGLEMAEQLAHPFSIKIERDLLNEVRSRWALCEGDQILIRSPQSYTTRREAQVEAEKVLERHVNRWRYSRRDERRF